MLQYQPEQSQPIFSSPEKAWKEVHWEYDDHPCSGEPSCEVWRIERGGVRALGKLRGADPREGNTHHYSHSDEGLESSYGHATLPFIWYL